MRDVRNAHAPDRNARLVHPVSVRRVRTHRFSNGLQMPMRAFVRSCVHHPSCASVSPESVECPCTARARPSPSAPPETRGRVSHTISIEANTRYGSMHRTAAAAAGGSRTCTHMRTVARQGVHQVRMLFKCAHMSRERARARTQMPLQLLTRIAFKAAAERARANEIVNQPRCAAVCTLCVH